MANEGLGFEAGIRINSEVVVLQDVVRKRELQFSYIACVIELEILL